MLEIGKKHCLILFLYIIQVHSYDISSSYPMHALDLVQLLDNYYYFSDFNLTWFDAMKFCKLYGMELVKVETVEENIAIKNKLETMPFTGHTNWGFYTSGHRMGKGSVSDYRWADGTSINWTIQEWCVGQPDDVYGEDCLEYFYLKNVTTGFCWNNVNCAPYSVPSASGRYFICEQLIL